MNQEQSQTQPQDVGTTLRQRRMTRGQSLDTVHQHTRIPKKFLEALEANHADAFPAPVYMRSFLKGYCDYLELDFDALWRQAAPASAGKPGPAPAPAPAPKQEGKPSPKAAPRREAPMTAHKVGGSGLMLPLNEATMMPFLLVAGLLAAGALTWLVKGQGEKSAAPRPPVQNGAAVTTPDLAPLPPAEVPELSLDIVAVQETWIRLKSDGALRFEGRLPAGTLQNWKAKKGFELKCADPRSLRLRLDGKDVGLEASRRVGEGSYALSR